MPNAASRLITLIMLLQRQPNQKAASLAAELGVSVRTLHRYLDMLDEMGIPVYSERGPLGGFSLVRGYRMPPLVFTPEEAVTVHLGVSLVEETWGQLYREAARGALAKLENVLPDEQRHEIAWARRALAFTGLHHGDLDALAPTLEKLRRATREHRRVQMIYAGGSQPESGWREFEPYALAHRWGWWYTIGFCRLRQELRTFRVDRIREISLLEVPFNIPASFDLQAYLAQDLQSWPRFTARMRFTPRFAYLARENRTTWENLADQPDGSIIVDFISPTIEWAASMVLGYGPGVEALEPPELVREVTHWAEGIVQIYKKE